MILEPHVWEEFYQGIREDKYTSSERKFSIFVNATDADSVCSFKVLQAILMSSQASISSFLVSSESALKIALEQELKRDVRDLRTVFCINCGGTMDVQEIRAAIGERSSQYVRLVVIDSHRPVHHSFNDSSDADNVILHDPVGGDIPVALIPLADAAIQTQGRPSQRRRLDENGDSTDGEVDMVEREAEVLRYLSQGSSYGIAASMILFKLAHMMALEDNFLFWMAVLGVTEQVMLRRVQPSTPHHMLSMEQLHAFTETVLVKKGRQQLFGEGFDSDDEDAERGSQAPMTQRKCAQGEISRSLEPKLLMHRHWSLYDALVHSPLCMAHFKTFKESQAGGRGVIFRVLAAAGIPIAQARMNFSQMKVKFKSEDALKNVTYTMWEMARSIAASNKDLYYDSFTVTFTSRLTLSAADHVHALWAHLTAASQSLCDSLEDGFWDAYTATDIRTRQVARGLELAMAQHRQLLQDVAIADPHQGRRSAVMQDGLGGPGQCLDLSTHDAWASASPLIHPLAISRLGSILQDVDAAPTSRRTEWRYQSIVCIGPPDARGMCMSTAITGMKKPQKHPVTKEPLYVSHNGDLNVYGAQHGLLRTAVASSHVNSVKVDFFDSGTFTIHRHDVDVFLQQLTDEYEQRDEQIWAKEGLSGLAR